MKQKEYNHSDGFGPLHTTKNPETKAAKGCAHKHHLKCELFFNSFTVMKMRRIWLLWVGVCWVGLVQSQKSDYVWLQGYESAQPLLGTSILDFNYSPRQVRYDSLNTYFEATNTSFCDSAGNLMFYSNGVCVANRLDQKMENGDSLNSGYVLDTIYPEMHTYGYRVVQGIIALPSIANPNEFYLLHSWVDTFYNGTVGKRILVTTLDMSANGGLGKVTSKNETIVDNLLGVNLSATRHGNGKNWWLLVQKLNSNCFYRILIDSSGIHALPDLTCAGTPRNFDYGTSCFSPDGNKYASMNYNSGLNIYDFDRCSGELSNALSLPFSSLALPGGNKFGVAFSPNSRFLYVSAGFNLFQFDMWAADVLASKDTVGIHDGQPSLGCAYFLESQIGPDGKIYISAVNDTVYHVIERPDEKGDSCLFKQHSLSLPSINRCVPNFPNYRLGALAGSPCDTLTAINNSAIGAKEKILKVFPNPATENLTIDYGFTDWSKGEVSLEITNALGQVVYKQDLPMYSGFQKVNVGGFAAGLYQVFIKRRGVVVAVEKLVKE